MASIRVMPVYIALLRGINVSGHKLVKMERLRAAFTALGFTDVKTYVQSGNVVFAAPSRDLDAFTKKIEKKILENFGFAVPTFLLTAKGLEETVSRNPFLQKSGIDLTKLHVTFLAGDAPTTALDLLSPLAAGQEQLHVLGREIYLYCPNGYGDSKLANTNIEKKLSLGATTRNWKTVNTLLEMSR